MLGAGTIEQVDWNDNAWLFLDIGFSANKSSSGLLFGNGEPRTLQFGEASRRIVEPVRCATSPTSLVIEAPLWVCFNRTAIQRVGSLNADLSKERRKTRYWHVGLGCAVMVAAMYLIRELAEETNEVRLFEGFVSYKDRAIGTDHRADVILLREVVKDPKRFRDCIIGADKLCGSGDKIVSAFKVCGIDCGVRPVIKRQVGK